MMQFKNKAEKQLLIIRVNPRVIVIHTKLNLSQELTKLNALVQVHNKMRTGFHMEQKQKVLFSFLKRQHFIYMLVHPMENSMQFHQK